MTQRIPPNLTQHDPSLQNCLVLLRAVWQREYEQVYKILRELPWSDPLKPVVNSFGSQSTLCSTAQTLLTLCSSAFPGENTQRGQRGLRGDSAISGCQLPRPGSGFGGEGGSDNYTQVHSSGMEMGREHHASSSETYPGSP